MGKHLPLFMIVFCFLLGLMSCEKPLIPGENLVEEQEDDELVRVTFQVSSFEQIPFLQGKNMSRAANIKDVCSRIGLALFQDGVKIKSVNQTISDENFGQIEVAVAAGKYRVVAIAHQGDGSATISSPEEVTFAKNKVTDTFYYCQDVEVGNSQTVSMEMKRAVAMFRLVMTDLIPNNVSSLRFYYTGGSSTFCPQTGFGCVNSRQTEDRSVTEQHRNGNAVFEVYTMPHTKSDVLKMTVSAINASGDVVYERVFDEVPVTINEITQYKGDFFIGKDIGKANVMSFWTNDQWTLKEHTY